MPVLIPRIRTVGVRLSEEEYRELEKFCVENRARSISDVARAALQQFLHQRTGSDTRESVVVEHGAQLRELEGKLEQLTATIALMKAQKGEGSGSGGGDSGDMHGE